MNSIDPILVDPDWIDTQKKMYALLHFRGSAPISILVTFGKVDPWHGKDREDAIRLS